jgi:hypothetical protein
MSASSASAPSLRDNLSPGRERRRTRRVDRRLERQSRNEALMREVNERIAELDKEAERGTFAPDETLFEFLCECGSSDGEAGECLEHVSMTINEYDQVRSQDDRFVVAPGHETATLESVVSRTERFVIVDKKPAAEPFVADDPRGAPST